ncbi:MAG: zinc ribbon domain-containing protein, partial [Gemmatimonadetes bacterium]|nr:zinc ribbon domain-containing protein [Gemmatimonadota bacterium]
VRPTRIAELLDDYRQLMMRLVAGERNLVEADPEVRAACRAALASRHPDLSLLETHGDRLVTLVTAAITKRPTVPNVMDPDPAPHPLEPPSVPPARPSAPTVRGRPIPAVRPSKLSWFLGGTVPVIATRSAAVPRRPSSPVQRTPIVRTDEEVACHHCTHPLPEGRAARFCPWCGQHLLAHCRMCHESIEASWIFCITCGHPT